MPQSHPTTAQSGAADQRVIARQMSPAQMERMAFNLCNSFDSDFVLANKAFALAVWAEAFDMGAPLSPAPSQDAAPSLGEEVREAAQALLNACVEDFGYGDEAPDYPDADDAAVAAGLSSESAVKFGHLRRLRDALALSPAQVAPVDEGGRTFNDGIEAAAGLCEAFAELNDAVQGNTTSACSRQHRKTAQEIRRFSTTPASAGDGDLRAAVEGLRALSEAATPGSWLAEPEKDMVGGEDGAWWLVMADQPAGYGFDRAEDACLAAAAVNLIRAALARPSTPAGAVGDPVGIPRGWRLVPRVPTEQMLLTGRREYHRIAAQDGGAGDRADKRFWFGMLDAAPEPPAATRPAPQPPAASPGGEDPIGIKAKELCAEVCDGARNGPCDECTADQEHDWRGDAEAALAPTAKPEPAGREAWIARAAEVLSACEIEQEIDLAVHGVQQAHIDAVTAIYDAARPVAEGVAGETPERVRHVKRGTEYEVLGEAEAQISNGMKWYGREGAVRLISDGHQFTVYRCIKTGKLWCRFTDEFRDGRFAPATAPATPIDGGKA